MRVGIALAVVSLALYLATGELCRAGEPLAVRVEAFTVAPAQTPMVYVVVQNRGEETFDGTVAVRLPGAWKALPEVAAAQIAPGQTTRLTFATERGANAESNRYPVEVVLTDAKASAIHRQEVFCASAPFFRPEIDGQVDDWKDAIPVTWETGGKRTTVSTYWNRRAFSLLVAVEEEALLPLGAAEQFDAVQFALAPEGAVTGDAPEDEAQRFEFLLVAGNDGRPATVFQLAAPGMKLALAAQPQALEGREAKDAELVVRREAGVTYYECSLPFGPMREALRPTEGRTFLFSVLVHDPAGTGLRDLGCAAGLWPSQRNPLAWSRFEGDRFGDVPPYDSKIPWGFCSSKY